MNIIGIDPGKSGAIAIIPEKSVIYTVTCPLSETEQDIFVWLNGCLCFGECFCYIENVHSMPKQGVVSAFSFGRNFGFLIGLLTALKIPYEFVSPQKWQKALGCLSKGDKNVTKAAAQRLFPDIKITHSIADALLISEYGRRTKK
jgi:crossover junction endodeoxyribonuclease RuvC